MHEPKASALSARDRYLIVRISKYYLKPPHMGANDALCQLHVCVAMYEVYMYIIRNVVT